MRVVVVGAGVLGLWTGLWLRRRGHAVTVIDQYGPGNALASSTDETRIDRSAHGADSFYPVWQRRALEQWRALEGAGPATLFQQTGVLWFAHEDSGFEETSMATMGRLGIPAERWSASEVVARHPAIGIDDLAWGLFEPEAGALLARRAVASVAAWLSAEGGGVRVGAIAPDPTGDASGALARIDLIDGSTIDADAFVFACGPWLPRLFPDLLGDAIAVTRRDIIQFATPPGDTRFDLGAMPVWIDYDRAMYGCPSIDGGGFKCCPDWSGGPVDPERLERRVSDEAVAASRTYMRTRFPAIAERPVAAGRVSQYELTRDSHFIIDRHPHLANAWIVGGGSGHAFKHGPVVGQYVAALMDGDEATVRDLQPPDGRFAIGPRKPGGGLRTSGQD